ncbi:MAG: aminotransferase class V-fold PLP-dependent enzyme [Thermoplasmata archaeon]|nr:MAG: aminotransferase class V-fold PLP-dependent enzyme [Thermoplasmata archaeon]
MDVQRIRGDFPILAKEIYGKPIIYLDSACMTLKPKQVIEAMNTYYYELASCAGRSVHKMGTEVTIKCDSARRSIAKFFNARKPEEIVFTRNTTEGINIVARCLDFKKGDVVLTTDREHNSNMAPWHLMREFRGIGHEIVHSLEDSTFDMEAFEKRMGEDVRLVSMVHTSNLEGYTIPAKEIIKIVHDHGALVMLDGSQSAAHSRVDFQELDVDFFSCSLHKMCGPTGMGVLYGKYDLLKELSPFIVGGDTVAETSYESTVYLDPPKKFEGGLQNYAGIIGSGAAVEYLSKLGMENIREHEIKLNTVMTSRLAGIPNLHILGPEEPEKRGGVVSFWVEGMDPHDIAMILDEVANIMIRSGMHCVHSWFKSHGINGSARASAYLYNTEEEAKTFADTLEDVVGRMG